MTPLTSKFWESAAAGVADKWLERLFSPSLVFWAAAGAAYSFRYGRQDLIDRLSPSEPVDQAILVVMLLVIVVGTSAVTEATSFWVLRILEGYFPKGLGPLRRFLTKRKRRQIDRVDSDWGTLAKTYDSHSAQDRQKYTRLDRIRVRYPENRNQVMPTSLGNIMRACETYPQQRYGIAATLLWPRIWLAVPTDIRAELGAAQTKILRSVQPVFLSVLSFAFVKWAWWFPLISIFSCWMTYRASQAAAATFGDLLCAAFDLYHRSAIELMGWPLPPEDKPLKPETGRALTQFIRRGDRPSVPVQQPPETRSCGWTIGSFLRAWLVERRRQQAERQDGAATRM